MKITKAYLKKLIKEEIDRMNEDENPWADDDYDGRYDDHGSAYGAPEFTAEEKKVLEQIDSLIDAIEEMKESNPELTDHYVNLFRALERVGVDIDAVAKMT